MTFFLTIFFLLLNAFFVASEFAIVKIRVTQVDAWVKKGILGAWFAQHAAHRANQYLSATQLGITIASLGLGWASKDLVEAFLLPIFSALLPLYDFLGVEPASAAKSLAVFVGFSAVSAAHIIVGETAPKNMAVWFPERVILWVAPAMFVVYVTMYPAVWTLNWAADGLLALFGIKESAGEGLVYSREELEAILATSQRKGALPDMEARWLTRIFRFGQTLVREVMVPRTDMVCVGLDDPVEHTVDKAVEEGFSRLPVYKEHYDNIVGILHVKDLLNIWKDRNLIILQDTMRPPLFVPETKKVSELLREFQKGRHHMAIVVDEFGGTSGLVTLEDLIEEIVGDIRDEYDTAEDAMIVRGEEGAVVVDGRVDLQTLQEEGGITFKPDGSIASLSGYIAHRLGRVPHMGEELTIDKIKVTVLEADRRRVHKMKLQKIDRIKE